MLMDIPMRVIDRIFKRIDFAGHDVCWEWPGSHTQNGYGTICWYVDKKYVGKTVHRVVYEAFNGPIEPGLDMDHLCRNRICFNPSHLEPVSRTENSQRGAKYRPTHCKNGHEYTPENSHFTKLNHIRCRECNKIRLRRLRHGSDSA
jgi:hypothetical protein